MIDRKKLARFIDSQLAGCSDVLYERKDCKTHYGVEEFKDLMDFIYGGPPLSEEEYLGAGYEWYGKGKEVK